MTPRNIDQNASKNVRQTIAADKAASTEDLPPAGQYIDKMPPDKALAAMLANQAHAITAVEAGLDSIHSAAVAAHQRLCQSDRGRLLYSGAGTSARIGVQDGAELPPTFNWPHHRVGFLIAGGEAALLRAVENAEDNADAAAAAVADAAVGPHDVVIGLAASGRTVFTASALRAARQAGAVTIGIANNPDTTVLAVADHPILLATGGEIIAGSTRLQAGTAQKICLNLLSNMIMVMMGFVVDGMMAEMVPTNEKLRHRRRQIDARLKRD
jgi:N-acetylmuramic acid 6-phosphate etherase